MIVLASISVCMVIMILKTNSDAHKSFFSLKVLKIIHIPNPSLIKTSHVISHIKMEFHMGKYTTYMFCIPIFHI